MADGFVRVRVGEKRPIQGQAIAQSGTLTIQTSPQPKLSLYAINGMVVPGLDNINVTDYDPGPLADPRVWFNLDTVGSPTDPLPAGYYAMVFKFTALGSDSLTRVYEPTIDILVMPSTGIP